MQKASANRSWIFVLPVTASRTMPGRSSCTAILQLFFSATLQTIITYLQKVRKYTLQSNQLLIKWSNIFRGLRELYSTIDLQEWQIPVLCNQMHDMNDRGIMTAKDGHHSLSRTVSTCNMCHIPLNRWPQDSLDNWQNNWWWVSIFNTGLNVKWA